MLTSFGRCLRKLRIDNGELLKDMAANLGITASYLSAVENGKRPIPKDWLTQLHEIYQLDDNHFEELRLAAIDAADSITLSLQETKLANKEVAFVFARKVESLPSDKLEKIKKLLEDE